MTRLALLLLAACSTQPVDNANKPSFNAALVPPSVEMPTAENEASAWDTQSFTLRLARPMVQATQGTGWAEVDAALAELGITDLRPLVRHPSPRAQAAGLTHLLRFESSRDWTEVVDRLTGLPGVRYVQPDARGTAQWVPSDSRFDEQWNLAELGMTEVWDITRGAGVVVAVVDTGVKAGGPDGIGNLLVGYNAITGSRDATDENGHGTHVAGTINQATDNGVGCAGMAPEASLLPVRTLDRFGGGSAADVADGIIWAVDNGAQIINLSLGFPTNPAPLRDAVDYAIENNVLIVAASGNNGSRTTLLYPAKYDGALAVGSTGPGARETSYSNEGAELDLMAPGGDLPNGILQETFAGSRWLYDEFEGTSMASPHVAGLAALVMSLGVTNADEVQTLLKTTAIDLGAPGRDNQYGHGIIDPMAAVLAAGGADTGTVDTGTLDTGTVDTGTPVEISCDGFAHQASGRLTEGVTDLRPKSGSYTRDSAGEHHLLMQGEPGTDFDLALLKEGPAGWEVVAESTSFTSVEEIRYEGAPGTYVVAISAYTGDGDYRLCATVPTF